MCLSSPQQRCLPPLEALVAISTAGDPTLDRPVQIGTLQQLVQIEPLELWAISKLLTGAVYTKVKVGE